MRIDKTIGGWRHACFVTLTAMAVAGCGRGTESSSLPDDMSDAKMAQALPLKRPVEFKHFVPFQMAPGPAAKLDSWPQFRGPDGQGHGDARNLPVIWNESQNIAWKAAIPGKGWSSPVIAGDRIWLTTATKEGHSLRVVCVDRNSGRLLYDRDVLSIATPPKLHETNSFASPTPVLDGERLYVHFGTMGTACLDSRTGDVRWKNTDLTISNDVGPGSSPVLHGNRLLLSYDGLDVQYVLALNAGTGKIAWKTDRSRPRSQLKAFVTPLVISVDGADQAIMPGPGWVIAYEPGTGQELWSVHAPGYSVVPSPVSGKGLLYIVTGFMNSELWAIHPSGARGNVTERAVVWKFAKSVPTRSSPLLVGDLLFFVSDAGILTCLNAESGTLLWRNRLGGNFSASPTYADGKIYLCSEEGKTFVIAADRTYRALAVNILPGRFMASPAMLGRALYLRTDTHLYRVEAPQQIARKTAVGQRRPGLSGTN